MLAVIVVVGWAWPSPPIPAERALDIAIVERDMILEELETPSAITTARTGPTPSCFWRCDGPRPFGPNDLPNHRTGQTTVTYGRFDNRADIDASVTQITNRLLDVGYTLDCTNREGEGTQKRTFFSRPSNTFNAQIVETRRSDGPVSLKVFAAVDGPFEGSPCD